MLGGSLGSTKVPEVLVWQGVCPGDRSPAFKLPAGSELEKRSGVAVGHDSSALQIPYPLHSRQGECWGGLHEPRGHAVIQILNQGRLRMSFSSFRL